VYKNIDEAMIGLSVWKKNRRTVVKPISNNIAYKPTFDADYYREAVLYRFIELVESSYQLYKSNLLVGSVVTARAAQETLAVAWYVNSKLELLCKNKDLSHFNDIIIRLTVGWSKDEEFPEKINVITCIEAVDKALEGKFKRHYDMLSEYAHPNWSGTMGAFAAPNKEKLEVVFGQYIRSEETMKKHVESTLIICLKLLNSIEETYQEVINEALDVCHELHGKGKLKEQLK
jgi:hypothetical protein